jgi:hypothetical protein
LPAANKRPARFRRCSKPWKSRRGEIWVCMRPYYPIAPPLSLYYARLSRCDAYCQLNVDKNAIPTRQF